MTQPLIAIIIPTYNRARLIGAAIESVIAQTVDGALEIAVVDDGSTDDTAQVLKCYLERFGSPGGKVHLTYTQLQKQGVVTARNTAIAQTTAPYIAFLDSDDYWDARKLELQLATMVNDPSVVASHTSFRYVDEQGTLKDDGAQRVDNPCVGDCLDVLLDEFLVVFSTVLARRDAIEQAAAQTTHGLPFDPRWTNSQDYDLMLRLARLGKFSYVSEPVTYYRLHSQHGAMGNLKRAFGFHCRVQLDFVERYGAKHNITADDVRRRVKAFLYGRAQAQFWQRNLSVARDLCDLADELNVSDERFNELRQRASKPRWLYRLKDTLDRMRTGSTDKLS